MSFVTIVLLGWRGAFLVAYVIAKCEQILPRLGHSSLLNVSYAQILHKLSNTAKMSNTAQTEQHGTNWATREQLSNAREVRKTHGFLSYGVCVHLMQRHLQLSHYHIKHNNKVCVHIEFRSRNCSGKIFLGPQKFCVLSSKVVFHCLLKVSSHTLPNFN